MTARRRITIAVVCLATIGTLGTGAALWLQGYRAYVVYTGSMSPTLRPGDLVIDRPADHVYRAGDVITFRHSARTADVVTHRVTAVTSQGIHTKGDANKTADAWTIRPDQVRGCVLFNLRWFGYVAEYLRQSTGIASICTIALTVILLWGVFFPPPAPSRDIPPTVTALDAA